MRRKINYKKKLWKLFSKFIRLRDHGLPCISCGKMRTLQAGHYYPRSTTYQSLYFSEENVHGQCVHCNLYLEGNKQGYRDGIIKRYGEGYLHLLEIKKSIKQEPWKRFEYDALIKYYTDKVREFK